MNDIGFAFPLPETEVQKLDAVREQLLPQPSFKSAIEFLRNNPLAVAGIVGALGILTWLFVRPRA